MGGSGLYVRPRLEVVLPGEGQAEVDPDPGHIPGRRVLEECPYLNRKGALLQAIPAIGRWGLVRSRGCLAG